MRSGETRLESSAPPEDLRADLLVPLLHPRPLADSAGLHECSATLQHAARAGHRPRLQAVSREVCGQIVVDLRFRTLPLPEVCVRSGRTGYPPARKQFKVGGVTV